MILVHYAKYVEVREGILVYVKDNRYFIGCAVCDASFNSKFYFVELGTNNSLIKVFDSKEEAASMLSKPGSARGDLYVAKDLFDLTDFMKEQTQSP